jgi:hypothetical protein
MNAVVKSDESPEIKLDIGCGPHKKGPDWTGLDRIKFDGVDIVCDAGTERWPFEDSTVSEIHSSHFVEHLTNMNGRFERVHFFNEIYRVLKPMAQCTLIFPHWASNRHYGDPSHAEPFSEFGFFYLDRLWRSQNAPHVDIAHNPKGYSCNLNCTWGYTMRPELGVRNTEYQQYAMANYRDSIMDIVATMTATKEPPKTP